MFAGKDASRALAKSSLKAEDAVPQWEDLDEKEQGVLNDWCAHASTAGLVFDVDLVAQVHLLQQALQHPRKGRACR